MKSEFENWETGVIHECDLSTSSYETSEGSAKNNQNILECIDKIKKMVQTKMEKEPTCQVIKCYEGIDSGELTMKIIGIMDWHNNAITIHCLDLNIRTNVNIKFELLNLIFWYQSTCLITYLVGSKLNDKLNGDEKRIW